MNPNHRPWTDAEDNIIREAYKEKGGHVSPSVLVRLIPNHSEAGIRHRVYELGLKVPSTGKKVEGTAIPVNIDQPTAPETEASGSEFKKDEAVVWSRQYNVKTLEELLAVTNVDLTVWEVERHTINKWEVAMREPATTVGGAGDKAVLSESDNGAKSTLWTRARNVPLHEALYQVKAWLRRKAPQAVAAESILKSITEGAPILSIPMIRKQVLDHHRALEVCIMDPHIGLLCSQPEADGPWDLELAASTIMCAVDDLIEKAMYLGPFDQVFLPFGNDWVHSDTVFHTTTAGTMQPESIAWHLVYEHAERIALEMISRLREIGKEIFVYEIPGNHSRMADFTLARLIKAYFHHDGNVHVDASPSPYKFHRYGVNLIGYEHGHSVGAIRLAALMANERRQDWAETEYREFHLGDQHRKGSSKPSMLEEQGVSVEYVPGLTPGNSWHRLKAFSHQQRGAMAWVWNKATGPEARFQFNISQYSHQPLIR
jgi:hypothetical protein